MSDEQEQGSTATSLRTVSYNIHACVGRDGRFMPERILQILSELDADVIALQEVEDRTIGGLAVSDYLANELGMQAERGPTLQRGDNPYGNLLLSRLPLISSTRHELSVAGREPRGAIEATFDADGVQVSALATHLGLAAKERAQQLAQLIGTKHNQRPDVRILLADFNEWRPGNALHRALRQHYSPSASLRTFPSAAPVFALDRIYVAPAGRIERIEAVRSATTRVASDHLPLVADIRL